MNRLIALTILATLVHSAGAEDELSLGAAGPESTTAATQMARTPSSSADFSDDLKKLKEASANKDEQGVLQAANHILGVDSKNLEALNALAVHYYNQGRMGLSKILLLRALNDHPDSATLYNNLGMLYLNENRLTQAIGYFRKATELKGGYPYAAANLGSIYLEYKDYKRAADALSNAYETVKSDLRHGSALAKNIASNYALALSGSGDLDQAKSLFQTILKNDDTASPSVLYNYAVLVIAKLKDKKEGEKIIAKLKLVADDSMSKRIDDLEKMLSGT